MAVNTKKRPKSFVTKDLQVMFANLKTPDVYKNSKSHNVTVAITPELREVLNALSKEFGGAKINGCRTLKPDNGDPIDVIKFKSKKSAEQSEEFPCVDSQGKPTKAHPYRGDIIRCRITPWVVPDDGSISCGLNAVQIVKKTPYNPFAAVEGGFVEGESEDPDETPENPF